MNYKVLYRKYRPNNFDTLVGQKHVSTILKNSIIDDKIAHAYLFSGPRGTGKTSTARIFAKAINCLNSKDGIPCEECEHCKSFETSADIIEIDAASNNGVDEIRELINNVKILPTMYKYKVYIIDEVHMLSQSAFNALLLTLEEPPQHVIFIMATTNLESVPITIVSRCQKFEFKKISDDDIYERLKYVCDEEKIAYDEEGLKEIVELSDGGLRDALSILDQLSKNDVKITRDLVSSEIGSISDSKIEELIHAIEEKNINSIEDLFDEFSKINLNYKVFIKKLINKLSNIAVLRLNDDSNWKIDFDTCKNIVFELNDLIMKISINVDAYLLIKMLLLSHVYTKNEDINVSKNEVIKEEVKKEIKNEQKIKKNNEIIDDQEQVNNDSDNEKEKIRINNCFYGASKDELNKTKEAWNNLISNEKNNTIKGLISDTEVVASSNDYAIILSQISHKINEQNSKLLKIEDEYQKINNKKMKFIFINEEKWQKEKQKYIDNIKNKVKYNLIEEKEENIVEESSMDNIGDVFNIDKIVVE